MKKPTVIAHMLIALGILTILAVTLFFHFYTYTDDGKIAGNWQKNETKMYLGTARSIAVTAGAVSVLGIALQLVCRVKTMRKRDIPPFLFVALGIFASIGFLTAFYSCTDMLSNRPMRCYWTMKILLGIAGAISVLGLLMLLQNRQKERIKGLNVACFLLSCLFVLVPTKITGVCLVHICVEKLYPFALAVGVMMLAVSVLNAIFLQLDKKEGE